MAIDASGVTFQNTLLETLGIRALEMGPDRVVLEMDVGPTVHQPAGLLHGGASATLAESAASIGAFANCDPSAQYAVGIELNISHLRGRTTGKVIATATPVRKGRSIHVWSISIDDEEGKPVAAARCTIAIRSLPSNES